MRDRAQGTSQSSAAVPRPGSRTRRGDRGLPDQNPYLRGAHQDRTNQHRCALKATNGQIIATSGQGYKDKRDAKNAIERIKSDAATRLKFETYADAAKEYRWRLKATNGQVIATSGQGYRIRAIVNMPSM